MRSLSGKELAKILEQRDWKCLRTQGSHFIYGKPGVDVRLSVPIHGNRPLKRGLQAHLLKLADIDPESI